MTKLLLAIVVISQLFILCVYFTGVIPLDSFWDLSKQPLFVQSDQMYWACAGLHMSTDVLIFMLPLPIIMVLRIPRRQKIALCGVFSLGFGYTFLLSSLQVPY